MAAPRQPITRQVGRWLSSLRGMELRHASTPTVLRTAMVLSATLALLFAVLGAYGTDERSDHLARARDAARTLLAVQGVRVAVVHADAIASQSYLVGGQEDPADRTAYLAAIDEASTGLLAVSDSVTAPADRRELAEAGRTLAYYIGLVEQARANNRQGFPVGAAYQRQANHRVVVDLRGAGTPGGDGAAGGDDALLFRGIVPALRTVEASQRQVVNDSMASAHRAGAWLQVTGWALVASLLAGGGWMAARFRRLVNLPLAAALAVVAIVLLAATLRQAQAMGDADDAVSRPLAAADLLSQARASAFDARAQEALALINRGSGQANQLEWIVSRGIVVRALDLACARGGGCELAGQFARYEAAYGQVRRLDQAGDWDTAVAISVGSERTDAGLVAPEQFDEFADSAARSAREAGASAAATLDGAASTTGDLEPWIALAGLVAGVLVLVGFGQRLREYR